MSGPVYYRYLPINKVWLEANSYPVSTEMEDVKELFYHSAQGEGDKHFVDVVLKSGITERHFVFDTIQFKSKENEE